MKTFAFLPLAVALLASPVAFGESSDPGAATPKPSGKAPASAARSEGAFVEEIQQKRRKHVNDAATAGREEAERDAIGEADKAPGS